MSPCAKSILVESIRLRISDRLSRSSNELINKQKIISLDDLIRREAHTVEMLWLGKKSVQIFQVCLTMPVIGEIEFN